MSLQDLITEKTSDEMLEEEISIAQGEGLATTTWQSGSVIRTILVILAHMFAMFSGIIVEPIKGGFGDLLSSLAWAKIWAKQMFDVDHVGAEAATGYVTITNATTTQHDLAAGELIVAHTTTGKTYRNTAAISILASSATASIAIAADEVGIASNAAPGAITTIVGPALDGCTVTNPLAVLGAEDETVPALVARSREKLGALSPDGPKEAYNYVVKTPELCPTSTPITRAVTIADPTTGTLTVYCATASGAPSEDDIEICQEAIETWAEPWCTTGTAVAVTEVTINVTYDVWLRSSLEEEDIKDGVETALSEYLAALRIGGEVIPPASEGYVFVSALENVIGNATVAGVAIGTVRVEASVPSADVELEEGEVAVLGTVTGTVHYLT